VWNAGEHVEGYTNFGWMLVMAAVHRAGAPDATASLWVRVVSWITACAALALAWRLLSTLGVHGGARSAAILAFALATDFLFWAVNGFETTLLTAVFLWALVRALDEAEHGTARALTFVIAGGLPLIRADAIDLTGVVNPAPEAVYRTYRYTNTNAAGASFGYQLPVPDGSYTVRLHAVESIKPTAAIGPRFYIFQIPHQKIT
jgi:hypothetical protein